VVVAVSISYCLVPCGPHKFNVASLYRSDSRDGIHFSLAELYHPCNRLYHVRSGSVDRPACDYTLLILLGVFRTTRSVVSFLVPALLKSTLAYYVGSSFSRSFQDSSCLSNSFFLAGALDSILSALEYLTDSHGALFASTIDSGSLLPSIVDLRSCFQLPSFFVPPTGSVGSLLPLATTVVVVAA
jgi:hypothetical protein